MAKKKKVLIRKRSAKAQGNPRTQHKPKAPTSDREFQAKQRAFDAIAKMRRGASVPLGAAARDAGTTPATVRKYLPAALRKSGTSKWIVTKSDRYTRAITLPGPHGPVTVKARGSKEAQLASEYLTALKRWSLLPSHFTLAEFHGKKIGGYELVTAPRTLRPLLESDQLQLDSLYAALKETR